jgi:hypothetical protein
VVGVAGVSINSGSVTLVETQHRVALEQLRRAGEQPVSLAALRAAGLDAPAAVISELELNGHAIERVYERGRLVGLRLIESEDADTGTRRRRYWWSRRHR